MKVRISILMAAVSLAAGPSATRTDHVKETLHGVELIDPYRWLEDQKSPETRAWIGEQNKHSRAFLDAVPGRDALRARFTALKRIDALSRPSAAGGRYFLSRKPAGKEQALLVSRRGLDGPEDVLVDPNTMGAGPNVSVSFADISEDGAWIAYAVKQGGKDEERIRIMQVATREHLADELPEDRYISFAFQGDNQGFYYSLSGDDKPRVRHHVNGTPRSADRDVFGEGYGAAHILACEVSEDGRWLVITVWVGSSGDVSEMWVKDLRAAAPPRQLFAGEKASFRGTVVDGRAIVLTNWKAPRWRVLSLDLSKAGAAPVELIPEGKSAINDIAAVGGRVLVDYVEDVKSRVRIYSAAGKFERDLPLPAIGSVSGLGGRWSSPELFYTFTSFHIPPEIHRFDLAAGVDKVWFRQNVPVNPADFDLRQVWYSSKDGTRVPMFLLHKKGLRKNGDAPVLLGGYGGFNVNLTPSFGAHAVVWAEQGGIYAIANLRGGGEFGEEWHRAGMRGSKQNVFDDFIAAGEHLIKDGYTKPARLAISGGSNGGLLVGAALTQRPDLFGAVLCSYPLLDMVRYHKFLVARFWVPEYGSSDDAKEFAYLRAYSPYHNVKKGAKYPATMIITGDNDTRVDPLHGRKMAALLQAVSDGSRPVLLRYDTEAGHSAGMSTAHEIEEYVDRVAFLNRTLGVKPPGPKPRAGR